MAAGRNIRIFIDVNSESAAAKMRALGAEADATATRMDRSFKRSQAALLRTSDAMSRVGRIMTGVGAVMAGVGYVSAKAAIDFQQSMERIHTQAGVAQGGVDQMSKSVLAFAQSGKAMQGPNDLANALYHIASVGIRQTVPAMKVLKIASEGAAVGGSDLEDTSSALAAAMVATHAPVQQAGHVMAILNATVGAGNMRMQDLVQAMGRGIIPAFQQVGLNIKDAMGALAVFTDAGINASSAAAQVSTALHFLTHPTAAATKELGALNMSSYQMAEDMHKPQGLLVALRDLKAHLDALPGGSSGIEAGQVLGTLFPGGRGRIMLTLFQNLDRYQNKLGQVSKNSKDFSQDVAAQQATAAFKLHAAWTQIQATMIKFGATLLPIIAKYLPEVTRLFIGMFSWLTKLSPATKDFLAKATGFAIVFGPMLIVLSKIVRAYVALRGAMVAIKAAGIAAGEGETAASLGAKALTAALTKLAPLMAIYAAVQGGKHVEHNIAAGNTGSSIIHGAELGAGAGVLGGTFFGPPGMLVGGAAGAIAGGGAGALLSLVHGLGLFGARGGLVTPHGIRHLAAGGPIGSDRVPAWLSAGEGVVNRVGMSRIGTGGLAALNSGGVSGGDQPIEITVNTMLDGRIIARSVLQQTLRKAARGPSSLVGGSLATGVGT